MSRASQRRRGVVGFLPSAAATEGKGKERWVVGLMKIEGSLELRKGQGREDGRERETRGMEGTR